MKKDKNIIKNGYAFERSTYNPALDYLIGKNIGKSNADAAIAFLKEYGLPKRFYEKNNL